MRSAMLAEYHVSAFKNERACPGWADIYAVVDDILHIRDNGHLRPAAECLSTLVSFYIPTINVNIFSIAIIFGAIYASKAATIACRIKRRCHHVYSQSKCLHTNIKMTKAYNRNRSPWNARRRPLFARQCVGEAVPARLCNRRASYLRRHRARLWHHRLRARASARRLKASEISLCRAAVITQFQAIRPVFRRPRAAVSSAHASVIRIA